MVTYHPFRLCLTSEPRDLRRAPVPRGTSPRALFTTTFPPAWRLERSSRRCVLGSEVNRRIFLSKARRSERSRLRPICLFPPPPLLNLSPTLGVLRTYQRHFSTIGAWQHPVDVQRSPVDFEPHVRVPLFAPTRSNRVSCAVHVRLRPYQLSAGKRVYFAICVKRHLPVGDPLLTCIINSTHRLLHFGVVSKLSC